MENDPHHIIQIVFSTAFFLVVTVGAYVLANFNRYFGPDPNIPSETGSGRAYSKVHIVLVWLHAVVVTGALALLLH